MDTVRYVRVPAAVMMRQHSQSTMRNPPGPGGNSVWQLEEYTSLHGQEMLIFVVDDEATITRTLVAIFSDAGFDAKGFINPTGALNAAQIICPDLLVTDVVMDHLNGVELGTLFRAMHPACRVLLFSGRTLDAGLMEDAKNRGHEFDFLEKPAHPLNLLATVNLVMA
jgi:FixJ family two-component response regulator